jgi:hypothetical protein
MFPCPECCDCNWHVEIVVQTDIYSFYIVTLEKVTEIRVDIRNLILLGDALSLGLGQIRYSHNFHVCHGAVLLNVPLANLSDPDHTDPDLFCCCHSQIPS